MVGRESWPPAFAAAAITAAVSGAATKQPVVIGFVGAKTGFMSIYDQQVLRRGEGRRRRDECRRRRPRRPEDRVHHVRLEDEPGPGRGLRAGRARQEGRLHHAVVRLRLRVTGRARRQLGGTRRDRLRGRARLRRPGCRAAALQHVLGLGDRGRDHGRVGVQEDALAPPVRDHRQLPAVHEGRRHVLQQALDAARRSSSFAGQDTFNNGDASIAAQVSRLRSAASKADFLVVSSLPPGGASAIRQIRGAGINLPILAAAAFDGSYWLSAVPKLSNFYYPALGSLFGDDPNPARAKLLYKDFKKVSGQAPTLASYPLLGYAAIQTLVRGMKIAKSTDGAAVAKALNGFRNVPLITGPTTYTAKCHIPSGRPYLIMQVQNGKSSYTGVTWKPASVPPHPC